MLKKTVHIYTHSINRHQIFLDAGTFCRLVTTEQEISALPFGRHRLGADRFGTGTSRRWDFSVLGRYGAGRYGARRFGAGAVCGGGGSSNVTQRY